MTIRAFIRLFQETLNASNVIISTVKREIIRDYGGQKNDHSWSDIYPNVPSLRQKQFRISNKKFKIVLLE